MTNADYTVLTVIGLLLLFTIINKVVKKRGWERGWSFIMVLMLLGVFVSSIMGNSRSYLLAALVLVMVIVRIRELWKTRRKKATPPNNILDDPNF